MSAVALTSFLLVLAVLVAVGFGPAALERLRGLRRRRHRRPAAAPTPYDPGQERRAELKARELLRSIVGDDAAAMYEALGFVAASGAAGPDGDTRYGYLIYPHRPLVSYDLATGELLSEHCVEFPDRSEPVHGPRLPDADDVLAKWMALRGDERGLIREGNMHLPGRQVDPGQVRRDLARLREWQTRRQRSLEERGVTSSPRLGDAA